MPEPRATVLIGDLEGSREREPEARQAVQEEFERILADLNLGLGPEALATPLVLTAGDEVQAVFHRPAAVVEAIQELTDRLYGSGAQLVPSTRGASRPSREPLRQGIAFGVARGAITTGPLPAEGDQAPSPARMDGPAFHLARDAVARAKAERSWACFEGFHPVDGRTLDALFALMGAIRGGWSTKQWITCYAARREEFQKDVAAQLRVSPSVVSESLKAADYRTVRGGEAAARDLLANLRATTSPGEET